MNFERETSLVMTQRHYQRQTKLGCTANSERVGGTEPGRGVGKDAEQ